MQNNLKKRESIFGLEIVAKNILIVSDLTDRLEIWDQSMAFNGGIGTHHMSIALLTTPTRESTNSPGLSTK